MNMKTLHALFCLFIISVLSPAFGQGGSKLYEPEHTLASVVKPEKSVAPAVSTSNRFHKKFPQLFSGLAIEIASSTYPMDRTAPVFRQFGNVYYEKLPEGGYSYLIMANFSSTEAGLEFVKTSIKPRAEKARLIQYSDGNRKVIRG